MLRYVAFENANADSDAQLGVVGHKITNGTKSRLWGSAKIRVKAATTDNRPLPTPSIRINQRPALHNPHLLPAVR
jgi:hypothetical protein